MVRARPVAYASAQRPLRTSYLIGLLRPQVGAIIQLPWVMVVMQPWLRERRLSVGAAARGQYLNGARTRESIHDNPIA